MRRKIENRGARIFGDAPANRKLGLVALRLSFAIYAERASLQQWMRWLNRKFVMARRTIPDDWALRRDLEEKHKAAIARKNDKIAMLRAMIEEWETAANDPNHLRDLRARLRSEESQLKVMKP